MGLNVCSKLCGECPFSTKSAPGWLAEYSTDDIQNFMNNEGLFPCHKMVTDEGLTQKEAEAAIKSGEIKLCRGYMESMIKTCKSPRSNKLLIEARALVKAEGLSEASMSIWDFRKHHESWNI